MPICSICTWRTWDIIRSQKLHKHVPYLIQLPKHFRINWLYMILSTADRILQTLLQEPGNPLHSTFDPCSFICQPSCVEGKLKLSLLKHVNAFSIPVMGSNEKCSRQAVGVMIQHSLPEHHRLPKNLPILKYWKDCDCWVPPAFLRLLVGRPQTLEAAISSSPETGWNPWCLLLMWGS